MKAGPDNSCLMTNKTIAKTEEKKKDKTLLSLLNTASTAKKNTKTTKILWEIVPELLTNE